MIRIPNLMRIARAAEEMISLEELQWRRDQRRLRRRYVRVPREIRYSNAEARADRKLDLQHEESQGMLEDE